MKLLRTMVLVITTFLLLSSNADAQLFQIGAGGGLTQILAPEVYTRSIEEMGFGFSSEWNAGVIAKLGLPLIPITPRAYFLYHSLSSEGQFMDVNSDYSQSISELGLGVQYNFLPLPAGFDPYIALDIAYNSFSSLEHNGMELTGTKQNRFGGGIGVGTEITIIPIINLDVYASYKMFNLIGKEDGEENVTAFVLDAFIMFSFL